MKGLDAPTMIGIIIAVIAGVIILYFLWTKGILPAMFGANEAMCKTDLIKACDNQLEWSKINRLCNAYYKGTQKSNLDSCINDPEGNTVACGDFCSSISS